MKSYEFGGSASSEERLLAAKARFRQCVLQNDTIFSLVQARLHQPGKADAELPDFGLEPTLLRSDDGISAVGMRINRSVTVGENDTTVHATVYDYISLGQMDDATGDTKASRGLEAALTATGKEITDTLEVWQTWQAGIGEMGTQFPYPLAINQLNGTFELHHTVDDSQLHG